MLIHIALVLFLVSLVQIDRIQLQRVTKLQPPGKKKNLKRHLRGIKWYRPSYA